MLDNNLKNNNAVIYARYSSAGQNETTIATQIKECTKIATEKGYKIIKTYSDEAKSGRNDNRPEFQNMITDAEEGRFSTLIMYLPNRFARNYRDSVKYYQKLKEYGVRILSPKNEYDGLIGDLIWLIDSDEAEKYSENLSATVVDALNSTVSNGFSIGGHRLLGYTSIESGKNRIVTVNEDEAPIVRRIFQGVADGIPPKKIYDVLNQEGYRTANGKPFSINSFQHALKNRKYIGEFWWKEQMYPNIFPQLIDKDVFERVQNILSEKSHGNGGGKAKNSFLLSGKAFCGYCGSRLVGTTAKKVFPYYNCSLKWRKKECSKKGEPSEDLEISIINAVIHHLRKYIDTTQVAKTVEANYRKSVINEKIKTTKSELSSIDKEFNKLMRTLYRTNVHSAISHINDNLEALEKRKEQKLKELQKIESINSANDETGIVKYINKLLKGNPCNDKYRQYIIHHFINQVFVYEDRIDIILSFYNNNHKLTLTEIVGNLRAS